jgi:hypothetical protein
MDVEEMQSSSKMYLRDVLWWKSIKDACRFGVLVIAIYLKKRCIFLTTRGRPFHVVRKHD